MAVRRGIYLYIASLTELDAIMELGISLAIQASLHKESTEEKRFYAGKTLKKFEKGSLAFAPVLLRSNLFGDGNGPRAVMPEYKVIPVYDSYMMLEYMGEELRQDDLRVLLALLRRRAGSIIDGAVEFTPRAFCRDELGWSDGGGSVEKLEKVVKRLKRAQARIRGASVNLEMSFISDFLMAEKGGWAVWLSPLLLPIFAALGTTYLKAGERFSMKDGLTSWLYGFIKSSSCTIEFKLDEMRVVSGSTYIQKEFNRAVSNAMKLFVATAIIKSFEITTAKHLRNVTGKVLIVCKG